MVSLLNITLLFFTQALSFCFRSNFKYSSFLKNNSLHTFDVVFFVVLCPFIYMLVFLSFVSTILLSQSFLCNSTYFYNFIKQYIFTSLVNSSLSLQINTILYTVALVLITTLLLKFYPHIKITLSLCCSFPLIPSLCGHISYLRYTLILHPMSVLCTPTMGLETFPDYSDRTIDFDNEEISLEEWSKIVSDIESNI